MPDLNTPAASDDTSAAPPAESVAVIDTPTDTVHTATVVPTPEPTALALPPSENPVQIIQNLRKDLATGRKVRTARMLLAAQAADDQMASFEAAVRAVRRLSGQEKQDAMSEARAAVGSACEILTAAGANPALVRAIKWGSLVKLDTARTA